MRTSIPPNLQPVGTTNHSGVHGWQSTEMNITPTLFHSHRYANQSILIFQNPFCEFKALLCNTPRTCSTFRNITGALGKELFLPTNNHVSTRRPDRLNHAAFLKGPMSWMQLGTSGLKSPVQLQCLYCRTGKTSLFKSAGKLWQR